MGVYIPNMDKPKSCKECLFEQAHYVNNYSRRSYCVLGAEQEHCPLIEIDLVKCEECEWSNGECSVGERYQGGCTFGERRADER